MVFLITLLIVLSCYVSVVDMEENCKFFYFVVVGFIVLALLLFKIIL
jgi:hypothetical protein